MSTRGSLLGLTVVDLEGRVCGRVEGSYPFDGSAPEFAIVRTGRLGQRVMVPLTGARRTGELLLVPHTRADLEDAPELDGLRYVDDAVSRTRGYWALTGPDQGARLPYLPLV